MGKKYYCDYCHKHIQRDQEIVRKHIEGIPHIRNRADHYERCKDVDQRIADNIGKKPCRTLITSEECSFGASCRYSHFTPSDLKLLQQKAKRLNCMRKQKITYIIEMLNVAEMITQQFLNKRAEKLAREAIEFNQFWTYQSSQHGLPPSLHEIDPLRLDHGSFTEWG